VAGLALLLLVLTGAKVALQGGERRLVVAAVVEVLRVPLRGHCP
jgi:hypothetical protein